MICSSCSHQNPERAKFCIECGTALAMRCAGCGVELPAGAGFCMECGAPGPGGAAAARPADADGERKTVSILFADLVGSTGLHERLDPESARRFMESYYAVAREAVQSHGGVVTQFLGDGVKATFGIPRVAENDAIRAVRAGVAMQQGFRALAEQQRATVGDTGLRVAVNTGEVIARGETEIIGDPVNVAARLQERARDGDVRSRPDAGDADDRYGARGRRARARRRGGRDGRNRLLRASPRRYRHPRAWMSHVRPGDVRRQEREFGMRPSGTPLGKISMTQRSRVLVALVLWVGLAWGPSAREAAGACNVDADCPGGWCLESTHQCKPQLPNDTAMPTDPPHTSPTLNGTCTSAAAVLVCASGVCDADNRCGYANGDGACTLATGSVVCRSGACDSDNKCGYANGDGPCTSGPSGNGATICRSAACSVNGLCEPAGGCNVDADCAAGDWCLESTHACTPKLANGVAMPTDAPHTSPTLNGTCTGAAAALVCTSGVCDAADNRCGYAIGDGPCTVATGGVTCRSAACSVDGLCEPAGGCNVDADCTSGQVCVAHACAEDTGFVPPDKGTAKCEDGVARNLSKLAACVSKCHIKQADAALKGTPFDEEACERGTGKPTSCRAAYDKAEAALLAATAKVGGVEVPLCPPCLDAAAQSNYADSLIASLDGRNGLLYCAGTTKLPQ